MDLMRFYTVTTIITSALPRSRIYQVLHVHTRVSSGSWGWLACAFLERLEESRCLDVI